MNIKRAKAKLLGKNRYGDHYFYRNFLRKHCSQLSTNPETFIVLPESPSINLFTRRKIFIYSLLLSLFIYFLYQNLNF